MSSRFKRSWMSVLIRLALILSLLTMTTSTVASLSGSKTDSQQTATPTKSSEQERSAQHHEIRLGPVEPQHQSALRPQQVVAGKVGLERLSLGSSAPIQGPVDLKLLVISADGQETDFAAITTFLNQLGIPYETLIATQQQLVPSMLWDGNTHGYYQGILLSTGSLVYFNGQQWISAFDGGEWATLWQYEQLFGIRQVTLYTNPQEYPENYGLNYIGYQDTSITPLSTQLTLAGQQVFFDLKATTPITIEYSWSYLATVISPTITTPLLITPEGYAIASITVYPDGRENLAITAANSPYLMHSMLLSYGILNWVTKGLFLGERHINLAAQIDDFLTEDDIWDTVTMTDTAGITYRMTGNDFNAAVAWKNNVQASPNAGTLSLEWAFNGDGASGLYFPDTLTPATIAGQSHFNWVNHTYSHENLDTISHWLATFELGQNHEVATNQLHLTHYFTDALVQPDISGLNNPGFLQAASDFGIRYLIADTSQPGWDNPSPNAGFYSIHQPNLLIIPRRPTNLFYNVSTPAEWVSEYNYFYAPGGILPYWDHALTYPEILDKESDVLLSYLLRWDLDPLMFHQPNTRAYSDTTQSLLSDLIDVTLAKYNQRYDLPIRNLSEHEIGAAMANRMAYNSSGVRASIVPCSLITLTTTSPAVIPVTGIAYGPNHEVYGGQNISFIPLAANETLVLPSLPPCQKIAFEPIANKTYGDPSFAITATASSHLTVTFSAAGSCQVGNSTLNGVTSQAMATITGAGSCTITAAQSGDASYDPAPLVSQTFTISRADQTITFGSLANKTFNDPPFTITATVSSGLAVTFAAADSCLVSKSTFDGSVSAATVTLTGVGACTITATQPGNANYNAAAAVSRAFRIVRYTTFIPFISRNSIMSP